MTDKEQIAVRLHKDTKKELDQLRQQMHVSRAAILEMALADFFKKKKAENQYEQAR